MRVLAGRSRTDGHCEVPGWLGFEFRHMHGDLEKSTELAARGDDCEERRGWIGSVLGCV